MPLVLTLKDQQDFYAGDEQFTVIEILSETHFRLKRERNGQIFHVTERWIEVCPNVLISAGDRCQAKVARLAIEAPRDILVVRGERYRNPPPEVLSRQVRM